MKAILRATLIGALLLTLTACVANKTLHGWKDEKHSAPLQKVLLIAVAEQDYLRHQFENVLANQLNDRGVDAAASFKAYPELGPKTPRDEALAKVRELGFESVLIVRLLSKEEVTNHAYSNYYFSATSLQSDGWHTYYTGSFIQTEKATDITYYTLSIGIFDVASTKPFWHYLFQVRDDFSKEAAVNDFVPALIRQLDKNDLLPKP